MVEEYVLETLMIFLPSESRTDPKPEWTKRLQLADSNYNRKSGTDLILGAEVFEEIIGLQIIKGNPLLAQKTILGWVLSGKVLINPKENTTFGSNNLR